MTNLSGDICEFRASHDADGQPTGPACGSPAEWVIVWPQTRQWSPTCTAHRDALDDDAPPHSTIPAREWLRP